MKAKLIEYAYPTSTHATKQGYGKTGCWFVSLYPCIDSCIGGKPVKHFLNKQDAEQFAEAMEEPYNFMHKYHNQ